MSARSLTFDNESRGLIWSLDVEFEFFKGTNHLPHEPGEAARVEISRIWARSCEVNIQEFNVGTLKFSSTQATRIGHVLHDLDEQDIARDLLAAVQKERSEHAGCE